MKLSTSNLSFSINKKIWGLSLLFVVYTAILFFLVLRIVSLSGKLQHKTEEISGFNERFLRMQNNALENELIHVFIANLAAHQEYHSPGSRLKERIKKLQEDKQYMNIEELQATLETIGKQAKELERANPQPEAQKQEGKLTQRLFNPLS